ncbi:hypothetical protein SDC9_156601 [bioreactor metagenome]|uniref:Uncharacterized protein n=1 Tax=bioreactor metagenome TaxID=1076179 RepID=A0A645F706_9ZZZZ
MPYLNTFAVAKRSQKTELKNVLAQYHLLDKGTIDFHKKVSDTIAEEISSKFNFLAKRNEKEFLFTLLNSGDQKTLAKSIERKEFGLVQDEIRKKFTQVENTHKASDENRLEVLAENKFHAISGYDYIVSASHYRNGDFKFDDDTFTFARQEFSGKILSITLNGKESWDVSPLIHNYLNQFKNRSGQISVPEISFENDLGKYHLKLVFDNLILEKYAREQIFYNDAYLLVRKK